MPTLHYKLLYDKRQAMLGVPKLGYTVRHVSETIVAKLALISACVLRSFTSILTVDVLSVLEVVSSEELT
jgi:hypothetical protein